jgi:hypothetical protein
VAAEAGAGSTSQVIGLYIEPRKEKRVPVLELG